MLRYIEGDGLATCHYSIPCRLIDSQGIDVVSINLKLLEVALKRNCFERSPYSLWEYRRGVTFMYIFFN